MALAGIFADDNCAEKIKFNLRIKEKI
jgi:hypothetical protein